MLFLTRIFVNFNKFVFLNSQGNAATYLRFGGKCHIYFIENFMRFTAVKTIENCFKFDKVTAD